MLQRLNQQPPQNRPRKWLTPRNALIALGLLILASPLLYFFAHCSQWR